MKKNDILNLRPQGLRELALSWGLRPYIAEQVLQWVYKKRATDFEEMSNVALTTREKLKEHFFIGRLQAEKVLTDSHDGSQKFLFKLEDNSFVESVLMPIKNRLTLCLSTQVGCAMGCTFCRTAELKLKRNLTAGEIVSQLLEVQRRLGEERRVTNLVMMGMGEPFHNYDNLIAALSILTDPNLCSIGKNKVTVSTCGLVPEIEKFRQDSGVKLAVSLNATNDRLRSEIMPVNKGYPLKRLMEACRNYAKGNRHKVTFEYVMFGGVNDRPEDMKELAKLVANVPCKINLIPFNPYPGARFTGPSEDSLQNFFQYLADRHFQVNIRYSKAREILGACGQLAPALT